MSARISVFRSASMSIYGMADFRIGVARLDLPSSFPPSAPADHPDRLV
jgi:hypothetical protein